MTTKKCASGYCKGSKVSKNNTITRKRGKRSSSRKRGKGSSSRKRGKGSSSRKRGGSSVLFANTGDKK